ncbi:FecR domain-containing protein [Thermomonas sp. HDW16]|uniref:FecR family protein n=1 Tax=Thermomonas sp. HDW16 TaxID=2714945 RepID=UPI001F0D99FE|nr:FecR domain-containing protein [Thermomonas sp. HDW16]
MRTDIEGIAADWLALRDSGAWTPADAAALDAWLEADTMHRVALLRLQAAWDESGRLQALGAGWKQPGPPPRAHWTLPAQAPDVAVLDADPPYAPPDLRDLEFAPRRYARANGSHAARAFAALSIAACAVFASWGWQSYHRVESTSYHTALGGLQTISLADGSKTTLASNSQLDVHLSRRERHIDLERGEAIFDVAKDPQRPFVVDAGSRQVVAVGTHFSVRRDAHELRVVVTEGTVRLQSPAGGTHPQPTTLLPAGSVALVREDGVLVRSIPIADAEQLLDWREGLLVFRNATLADAAAEFNRYNARKIVVADAEAGALRVGGSFRWENTEGFARLLERGFPVRAEYAVDRIVLASP